MKNLFTECLHKDLNNRSGIYAIRCGEHLYIGSSINIYYRLKRHVSDMRKKKHSNSYLQNIYNKHTEANIYYNVVEYCEVSELLSRETFYIKSLNPDVNLERECVRRVFTKEVTDKIKNTLKKRYAEGSLTSLSNKKVYRYSSDGVYIDSYESCTKASNQLNLSSKKISAAASGKNHSSGGFIWSYDKKDCLQKPIMGNKHVHELDSENNMTRSWNSLKDCAKELKLKQCSISQLITSKRVRKGFRYIIPVPL